MRRLLILAAIPLLAGAQGKVHRDWEKHPAIVQAESSGDVFAVGDVHGDLERLLRVLRAAKVIGAGGLDWTAGHSIVVCTGDLIDKGPRGLEVIRYWAALGEAARKAGGQVIVTMGNHEAEFLANPSAAKTLDFRGELEKAGLKPGEVAGCRGDVGQFLCGLPFAARVNGWFFSHAGDTHGRTLAKLAADLQNGVDAQGFASAQLAAPDSLLEARLSLTKKSACENPWPECYAGRTGRQVLAQDAAALGVEHLVQGHQPSGVVFADGVHRRAGEMFQRYGLLFLIDTGMSRGVGDSQGAVLWIHGGNAAAICPDGTETVIWRAGIAADVGRAKACK
jgi:hypothetical protein